MKARHVFLVNFVVSALYALAFLFVPEQTAALYGGELTPGGALIARLYGGALVTFAVLLWSVRYAPDTPERQGLILALFAGDAIGFVVTLLAVLDGTTNTLGWVTVVTFLAFTVAYGYLRFVGEPGATRPQMAG